MLRKILAIAWNDIKIEFSEPATLVFFLILPLVFTLIIGQALGRMYQDDPSGDTRYRVLVVDEDATTLSGQVTAALEASEVVRPDLQPMVEAEAQFEQEAALALLIIPAGFEQGLLDGRPSEVVLRMHMQDNRSFAVEQAVEASLSQVDSAVNAAHVSANEADAIRPFPDSAARQAYFLSSLARANDLLQTPAARTELTQSDLVTVEIASGFNLSSPGQLVTWTLITLLAASEVFVSERLTGTLRRLLVTPTQKAIILLGKISGRLALGLLQMTILIGFGGLVLGVNWGHSPAALALVVVSFALAAVALGVLLGAFAKTRGQASGLTIMFSMLFAALGGAWWPLEVTPATYQTVVKVLPTTWAMMGFNDVIIRGLGVEAVLPKVGVLLAFALVFFVVGVRRLRFE